MHKSIAAVLVVTSTLAHGSAHAQTCSAYSWNNPSSRYPAGVEHKTFRSPSMGKDVGFNVYTPPEYAASTARYPVVYFLHGVNGDEGQMPPNVVPWVTARVQAGLMRPSILVFANGAIDSGYADTKDGRRVETSILKELIPFVDTSYRTNACREQRAISGFSMGGKGALIYAFKYPDLFGSVVAYAPALLDWPSAQAEHADQVACVYGNEEAYFNQYSPSYWLEKNATKFNGLRIRFSVGAQDGLEQENMAMDQRMKSLGIAHEFEIVPGCGHEHGCLWTTAGNRGIAFHEASLSACGSAPDPGNPDSGASSEAGSPDRQDPRPSPSSGPPQEAAPASDQGAGQAGGCNQAGSAESPALGSVVLLGLVALVGRMPRKRRLQALGSALAATIALGCSDAPPSESGSVADGGVSTGDANTPADAAQAPQRDASQGTPDASQDPDAGSPEPPPPSSTDCSKFIVSGDPTSPQGATWRYVSTDDSVAYDLTGVLLMPAGAGPFPGALVSHGKGGSATGYSRNIATTMRSWGLAAIATNYTHAATPSGLPTGPEAASPANLLRAYKARRLLACVPKVNDAKVVAHGHSMGALLTGMVLGTSPSSFVAASHSAGGVSDTGTVNEGVATTSAATAAKIRTPYQLHHGDMDTVVPLAMDQRLDQILTTSGTAHELIVYPGVDHNGISLDATMLERVRAWYTTQGVFR